MSGREDYKNCMTEKMRQFPKGISREERGKLFCVEAKLCSGKSKTKQEAEALCNQPKPVKEPKERKRRASGCPACPPCGEKKTKPIPENIPCPQRKQRVIASMDKILEMVKEGKSAETDELRGQVLSDVNTCYDKETGAPDMVLAAMDTIKNLGKASNGFYFKGETNEAKRDLELAKALL